MRSGRVYSTRLAWSGGGSCWADNADAFMASNPTTAARRSDVARAGGSIRSGRDNDRGIPGMNESYSPPQRASSMRCTNGSASNGLSESVSRQPPSAVSASVTRSWRSEKRSKPGASCLVSA